MLTRLLLAAVGGEGSFPVPEVEVDAVRGTSVKCTSNVSTPFNYYTTPAAGTGTNNGVVEFDTVEYDDDTIFDPGDPTKLGPLPSLYNGKRAVFHGEAIWDSSATGYREVKMFRNGDLSEPIAVAQVGQTTGNIGVQCDSRPIEVSTGDYFELCVRSGNSSTALAADDYSITFSIEVRMS